ncbi:hypothetical protein [Scytonema sp. UIC 10036]|uniref:hypothetical protein n=1 Tax=Scytonema sp. UIC 10036 TaxID=2304196 RepID=UPI00325BD204
MKIDLAQTTIVATADGIISQLNLRNPGQTLRAGIRDYLCTVKCFLNLAIRSELNTTRALEFLWVGIAVEKLKKCL